MMVMPRGGQGPAIGGGGQLRDEFRPEGVGALDEDSSGRECGDRKDEGRGNEDYFMDQGHGRMVKG